MKDVRARVEKAVRGKTKGGYQVDVGAAIRKVFALLDDDGKRTLQGYG